MHQHDHNHDHLHLENLQGEKKAFYSSLVVASVFMILEIGGGIIAHSLALISDGLHMFTDAGALFLGILVISIFKRPPSLKKTFGYQRAEVLGALLSGAVLWGLMLFLIYEGIYRLFHPPEVRGGIVFVIAVIGLIANFIMMKLLHPGHSGSLNIRAAYLHVLGDLLGSVGVIISGLIIWTTNWYPIDPIVTFFIAVLILRSSGKMMKEAIDILMEGVPPGIHMNKIRKDLLAIENVDEVHDLHVWSLSSRKTCLSAHIVARNHEKNLLQKIHHTLKEKHHIPHMTIQIEEPEHFEKEYCFDCQKN